MLRRHLIGAIGFLMLLVGGWYLWQGTQTGGEEMVMGSCVRIGSVLAVIWLAWPDLGRLPRFITVVGGSALAIMVIRPKLALYLLPLIVILWFLRPRRGSSARPLSTQSEPRQGAQHRGKRGTTERK